jgi:hypothetical protein
MHKDLETLKRLQYSILEKWNSFGVLVLSSPNLVKEAYRDNLSGYGWVDGWIGGWVDRWMGGLIGTLVGRDYISK